MASGLLRIVVAAVLMLAAALPSTAMAGGEIAPPVFAPVAPPIVKTPDGPIAGTIIMVHAGGWLGHDANAQQILDNHPGMLLMQRKFKVISLDYASGKDGLNDVLNTVGEELRKPTGRLLCLYGESAGGHLSLTAASRLPAIDCVITVGAPTDLTAYLAEAGASDNPDIKLVGFQVASIFGTDPAQRTAWDPVQFAPTIRSDILMMRENDDCCVSPVHVTGFAAARPRTQIGNLEAGDPTVTADKFVHGTLSAVGRQHYQGALGTFLDRVIAAHEAEREAVRTRCPAVTRQLGIVGESIVARSLRCLARKSASRASLPRTAATFRVRGEVNAARVWALMRSSAKGRAALTGLARNRASVRLRSGNPTTVVVAPKR